MNRLRLSITVTAFLALFLTLCNHAFSTDRILRVSDGKVFSLPELVKDLEKSRLVFVGELRPIDEELVREALD